jgi:NAD(P)H-hydrate epimerase
LKGSHAALIQHINRAQCKVYSIDIPSGLMGEDNSDNHPDSIIKATLTLTLQFPKISLLFPENEIYTGIIEVIDIHLHPDAIIQTNSPFRITNSSDVWQLFPKRFRFSHKGNYGHALLIAGSYGKMGASVLAAQGCLRSGVGLLTVHIPQCGYTTIQTAVPEAMCSMDTDKEYFTFVPEIEAYNTIGIGPGIGTEPASARAFRKLLEKPIKSLVIDADGLNILAKEPELIGKLPRNTIITPHPGEFSRLFSFSGNSWQRLKLQQDLASKYHLVIVLKGANTSIAFPDGRVFFNPTGNAGMATGGSGDVLTGIITGLLAQGLTPEDSAVAAVYLHGLAGDIAAKSHSAPALIASDIVKHLGEAYMKIYDSAHQDF